jgi:putative Holliday junction resolvase
MQRRIEHFVSLLELENIRVHYQDEQGSSMEAKELTQGVFRHKRDGKIDSIAAKIILERWLWGN